MFDRPPPEPPWWRRRTPHGVATQSNLSNLRKENYSFATRILQTLTSLSCSGASRAWIESGNEFITYVWEDDDADLWEQTREYNNTAICSKAMGFSFDNAKVTAELSALSNVTAQYTAGLECGVLDPNEYIPKLIDDMKSAGIDTVIAEKQSQLDAWLAEQNK